MLSYYSFNKTTTTKKALICLHGYGDTGYNFTYLASKFNLKDTVIIVPNAIEQFEHGFEGFQWFSLQNAKDISKMKKEIQNCCNIIKNFINHIVNLYQISYKDVYLLGFSQGAFLANQCTLTIEQNIAQCFSCSGGLSLEALQMHEGEINKKTPITIIHGDKDDVLHDEFSKKAFNDLNNMQIPSTLHIIKNMQHIINEEVVKIITNTINHK